MFSINKFINKYLPESSSEILIIHDESFKNLANLLVREYEGKRISANTFPVDSQNSLSLAVEQRCVL